MENDKKTSSDENVVVKGDGDSVIRGILTNRFVHETFRSTIDLCPYYLQCWYVPPTLHGHRR